MAPELSIIIPFYGNKKDLIDCLKGLTNLRPEIKFEIIIVESGNDPEVREITGLIKNSVLITCKSVMYPGKARNIGAETSKADLLAFIDADCVPAPDWIKQIFTSLKAGNEIVIGSVTNLYPLHPLASVDNLLQFPDFQKHRPSKNISHFPACNLGITKVAFLSAGKFPEEYLTGEDVKFSESVIRNIKKDILFNRKLIVRHSGRKQFGAFIEHNRSLGFHRGYLNLKILRTNPKNRDSFLFALMFGFKRLIYISIRTLQWNPAGLPRLIFYFPFLILGLSAWVSGFWKGNRKYMGEQVGK